MDEREEGILTAIVIGVSITLIIGILAVFNFNKYQSELDFKYKITTNAMANGYTQRIDDFTREAVWVKTK